MLERRLVRRCGNCGHVTAEAKAKTCIACGALLALPSENVIIKGPGSDPGPVVSKGA